MRGDRDETVGGVQTVGDNGAMTFVRTLCLGLSLAACGAGGDSNGDLGDDGSDEAPVASCGELLEGSGEATYYAADGSGNCSFDASPTDLRVAALNTEDYAESAMCGACVNVVGPDGSVTVRIVDRCPGCAKGDIDLSESAFAAIAPVAAGRVPVSWSLVPCEVSGAMSYRFKEGSSEWWTALQVRNHRFPVAKLEVRGADGRYRAIARENYNYFVDTGGLGKGPFELRITDVLGHAVQESGVELGDAVERAGRAQLPACD
jgi:expansin (peptidoglycan-binding protein)